MRKDNKFGGRHRQNYRKLLAVGLSAALVAGGNMAGFLPKAAAQTAVDYAEIGRQGTTASSVDVPWQGGTTTINYGVGESRILKSITANGYAYKVEEGLSASTYAEVYRVDNDNVQGDRQLIFQENESQSEWRNIRANEPDSSYTMEKVFSNANLSEGSDNVFANTGGNNINNIERISILNNVPLTSNDPSSTGIVLLERGGNDRFKVAAVKEIDANGNPTAWGEMTTVWLGDWGIIDGNYNSTVFRQDPDAGLYAPTDVSNPANQQIAAVLVTMDHLGVAAGETVYGVSLLPFDAEDPAQANPILTTAYSGENGGGLDFIGGAFVNAAPLAIPKEEITDVAVPVTVDLEILPGDSTPEGEIDRSRTRLNPPTNGTSNEEGTEVTVPGEGTYTLDRDGGENGIVTFTPEPGFQGPATPITYQAWDGNDQDTEATITIEVRPVVPTASPDTSTGRQGEVQSVNPLTNDAAGHPNFPLEPNTVTLLDGGGNPTESVTVPGEGVYTVEYDGATDTAKLVFTPEPDFYGEATPVPYSVKDSYGKEAKSTYTPTVNAPPVAEPNVVIVDQGETATLNPETTPGSGDFTEVTFDNDETTKVVDGEGTWTIKLENGEVVATFVPEADFTGPVTQQRYTVTDVNGFEADSTLDVIIRPATGDDEVTVNQGDTADLAPETKPGSGKIVSVVFPNGQSVLETNEGRWTINLDNGQPKAQFVPAIQPDGKPFTGPVTPQTYIVEDANGETASGLLEVFIRPETGDDSVVVRQGEVAELTPVATPGSAPIDSAVFVESGTNSLTVPGEGTWTISVVAGQPVAEFTPESNFTGPVTSQQYTVTDTRGEEATGNLAVIVVPETGDDTVIVAQGETAELEPTANPGSGDIITAEFSDGSSTLIVPGEGEWTVYVVNGQPKATFVPEPGFNGPVTPQEYTVTDTNGEFADGTLYVIIKPETGDDAVTIGVNEVATLTPETVKGSGDIVDVYFDNGEKTLTATHLDTNGNTVTEGVWTIELVNGQPVATFTPEKDYNGSVTSQKYTILDENNLPASGKLSVLILDPKINLIKTADPKNVTQAGEKVTYTFKAENIGNTPLNNVTISEDSFEGTGTLSPVVCGPEAALLQPNESVTCTAEYTVTQEDIDNGPFDNIATATGEVPVDPNNPTVDPEDPVSPPAEETVIPNQNPKLDLTKEADKQKVQVAGEKIVYTFVATNTGNVTLTNVKINEEEFSGTGTLPTPVCGPEAASLAPGESVTCTAEYSVTEEDLESGLIENVATSTGESPNNPDNPNNPTDPVSPPAEEEVPTEPITDVEVEKTVTGPKGKDVHKDNAAVFQVKATWTDVLGAPQEQIINVTPGKPVSMKGVPLNTKITLEETGSETSVSNVKFGDIIWSGTGVEDEPATSTKGSVVLTEDGQKIDLENETSSNGLIILPIPLPIPNGGGSSNPPAPTDPTDPVNPSDPGQPGTPVDPGTPGDKGSNTPNASGEKNTPAKKGGALANTGANVALLAGGAILLLIGGAWMVLRGRKKDA